MFDNMQWIHDMRLPVGRFSKDKDENMTKAVTLLLAFMDARDLEGTGLSTAFNVETVRRGLPFCVRWLYETLPIHIQAHSRVPICHLSGERDPQSRSCPSAVRPHIFHHRAVAARHFAAVQSSGGFLHGHPLGGGDKRGDSDPVDGQQQQ